MAIENLKIRAIIRIRWSSCSPEWICENHLFERVRLLQAVNADSVFVSHFSR